MEGERARSPLVDTKFPPIFSPPGWLLGGKICSALLEWLLRPRELGAVLCLEEEEREEGTVEGGSVAMVTTEPKEVDSDWSIIRDRRVDSVAR